MKNFTIGYRARFPAVLDKYLGASSRMIREEFDIITISGGSPNGCDDFSSIEYPAANYNKMIEQCATPYLILAHEDIAFTPDFLDRIQDTINEYPDFGALGLVGPDSGGTNRWSSPEGIYEVDTLDSCLIVVRKDLPVRFNAEIFNELHLYVEDFCGQLHALGKKIYTIKQLPTSKIGHASTTWVALGPAWGNYGHYKEIFSRMYPNLKTT